MSSSYMVAGQMVEWNNAQFKLDRLIGDEWQMLNAKTQKAFHLTDDEFKEKYSKGEIIFFNNKSKYVPESIPQKDGSKIAAHLDLYPKLQQETMKVRRLFLEVYLKNYGDLRSQKTINKAVKVLWKPAWNAPPHSASVARWLKRYIESGRDIRSLGSGDLRKGNKNNRYPFELTEICNQAISRKYLKLDRPSIKVTLDYAINLTHDENLQLPISDKLPMPTMSYMRSLIDKIPAYDKCLHRDGYTTAKHKFRNAVHGIVCERPLERVEIDHSQLDIMVVDGETGLPLGRPWLTMVIDVFSRAILGFSISFDPPSQMTVARALKMALQPKVNLGKRWTSVKGKWIMFGCMDDMVVDNGLEFHCNSLEAACYQLGINISYCPRKTPWWKAHIERAIQTMNSAVTDGMPGRTFSAIKEKGEYNPGANAAIPLKTMEEIIVKWIVDIYHQTTHSTLGDKPHNAWEKAINPEDIPMVASIKELDAVMGEVTTRALTHVGIELNVLRYNSDELGQIRRQFGDLKKVTIKWDPEDLGYIHVLPPDGKALRVPVVTIYANYAEGLTNYQHQACKKYSKKYLEGVDNVTALTQAKAELYELAEKGMREVSKKTRVMNHRLLENKDSKVGLSKLNNDKLEQSAPVVAQPYFSKRPKFEVKLSDRNSYRKASHENN